MPHQHHGRHLTPQEAHYALLQQIESGYSEMAHLTGRHKISPNVRDAFMRTERHLFVPESDQHQAYSDHPLPIGQGQTISQPFIVAIMTDLLDVNKSHRVLEIGTGSGYQTAILSLVSGEVFSVEVVPSLARQAVQRLSSLGYTNIHLREGNGGEGWPQNAPYDRIMVTAAAERIPMSLIEQLAVGGRMVIPVGPQGGAQWLQIVEKYPNPSVPGQCSISVSNVMSVRFVPFT